MLEKGIGTIDNKNTTSRGQAFFTIIRKYGQEIFNDKIKYRPIEKDNKIFEFKVVTLFLL